MESSESLSSSRKRPNGSGSRSLPEELIREILSWACVPSLTRCKSVCKLWLSIISEPEFLEAHRINSQKNLPSVLMITSRIDGVEEEVEGRHYGRRAATIVYPNSPEYLVELPVMPPFDNVNFVSSCNGIVCVVDNFNADEDCRGDIYLFNPLNWMAKKLPPCIVYENQCRLFSDFDVVFGFDWLSCDFKVLKIAYQQINGKLVKLLAVQLYSFDSNLWREIKVGIELPDLQFYPACPILRSGPVVDGILYLEAANTIITFSLHTELFGLIPYPSFMHTRKSSVLDFEGSVAVVLESVAEGALDKKEVSLWTVESVSDEVFWNKIFTFDAGSEEIDWVFVYCGADKFVGNTSYGTVLYDYRKKETKHIRLPSQSFLVDGSNKSWHLFNCEDLMSGYKIDKKARKIKFTENKENYVNIPVNNEVLYLQLSFKDESNLPPSSSSSVLKKKDKNQSNIDNGVLFRTPLSNISNSKREVQNVWHGNEKMKPKQVFRETTRNLFQEDSQDENKYLHDDQIEESIIQGASLSDDGLSDDSYGL
ncbi:hypothetical protein POM88_043170 [Heracleum sosnowskyi]|uniref:F-box domain-containing protein n=1 Tax=Heracleum sosnowskyi TaxID=360622 RepID=A0AAD8M2V7_9APIA|nr:hypothetical protein POM88_043170 [Heracleum sosnowskyi]